jgi:hypothetical protein
LDLLIESLMQRRFGKSKKASPKPTTERTPHGNLEPPSEVIDIPTTLDTTDVHDQRRAELARASVRSYIRRSTRRAVVERDGLGCSWIDEHGVRCGSHSWLEYDHLHPRAKGGGSEPPNLRILCRSHNRFAAEQVYGRKHIEHSIAERRRERAPHAI